MIRLANKEIQLEDLTPEVRRHAAFAMRLSRCEPADGSVESYAEVAKAIQDEDAETVPEHESD